MSVGTELKKMYLSCELLEAAERVRAGTRVGLPAWEAGMSGDTETSEPSPQSLTDILAQGDKGLPSI